MEQAERRGISGVLKSSVLGYLRDWGWLAWTLSGWKSSQLCPKHALTQLWTCVGEEQIYQQGGPTDGKKVSPDPLLGCQVFVSGQQGKEEAGQLVLAPFLIYLPVTKFLTPSPSVLVVNWSLNLEAWSNSGETFCLPVHTSTVSTLSLGLNLCDVSRRLSFSADAWVCSITYVKLSLCCACGWCDRNTEK